MHIQLSKKKNGVKLFVTSLIFSSLFIQPPLSATETVIVKPVSNSMSAAKLALMEKLAKLDHFSAQFNQSIKSEQGEVLQIGKGTLAIQKPNLVNWQTTEPDETLIVSDGNTLWFYDPFIEQANAYSLANAIHNTPILLLTSDEPQLWQQYTVEQVISSEAPSQLRYTVTPHDESSQIKQLIIGFSVNNGKSQLNEFSFKDTTNQLSEISLVDFDSQEKPNQKLFTFTLPEGSSLEDNR